MQRFSARLRSLTRAMSTADATTGNNAASATDATTSTKVKAKLNVHKFPRPPLCESTDRALLIKWGDKVVAETKPGEAYWVLETTHPPSKSTRWSVYHFDTKEVMASFPIA